MKKYTYLLVLLAFVLIFCGCGSGDRSIDAEANTEVNAVNPENTTQSNKKDTSKSEIPEVEESVESESMISATDTESTEDDVIIKIVGFSDEYASADFVMQNLTNKTYYFSSEFELQMWAEDEWQTCELAENLIWDDYLGILNSGNDHSFTISFEVCYEKLSQGKYRIIKEFSMSDQFENPIYVNCEFEVE